MDIDKINSKEETIMNDIWEFVVNENCYTKTVNGVTVKIAKKHYDEHSIAYADKMIEVYFNGKERIVDYIILKIANCYDEQYTADEIKERLGEPHIEILSKNYGKLVWLDHQLDEHIIECEFTDDMKLSYVTMDG